MSFLLHYNNIFSLVDNNSKYGVFCQFYNHTGLSRPLQIQSLNNTDYSAAMDEAGKLHVLTLPSHHQVAYFCYENGRSSKKMLVESTTETYTFSNPMIHLINNETNIFYLSNKALSNAYAIVHQTLSSSSSQTLLETSYHLENLKSITYRNDIYLFFSIQNTDYFLKCLKITNGTTKELTLLYSKIPISDYCVCLHEDHMDIVYVAEFHGKYQLSYYNTQTNLSKILCNTLVPSNPVIFWYYNYLWINYLDDNKLYILLSIDDGNSFSSPVLCSIQNNIRKCTFTTNKNCSLSCSELYASIVNTYVHMSTLFTIDFDHIHLDSKIPIELELLLEGLSLSQKDCKHAEELLEELSALKEENKRLKTKYDTLLSKSPNFKDDDEAAPSLIKSAASAFMEEFPTWNAPPRL